METCSVQSEVCPGESESQMPLCPGESESLMVVSETDSGMDGAADSDSGISDQSSLLERIRSDREDLEDKIKRLKSHIATCSDVMKKLKRQPETQERYNSLTSTRANLVKNAVNLQQLLVKLKDSETRAGQLANRESVLVAEFASRRSESSPPPAADSVNESSSHTQSMERHSSSHSPLDPNSCEKTEESAEDEANHEKKEELLKRIQHSQSQLRVMEAQQRKLRAIKEEIQTKLKQSKGDPVKQRQRMVIAAADSRQEMVLGAEGRGCRCAGGNGAPLAAGCDCWPPDGQLPEDEAAALKTRLRALQLRRQQVDDMVQQLSQLQPSSDLPVFLRQHTVGAGGPDSASDVDHGVVSHRRRLQQVEGTMSQLQLYLSGQSSWPRPPRPDSSSCQQPAAAVDDLPPDSRHLHLQEKRVQETREQLLRMRSLMSTVEEAQGRGLRLSDAVPAELTQLLSGSAVQQPASAAVPADQHPIGDGQSRACEYVHLLKSLQTSVDSLQQLQQHTP